MQQREGSILMHCRNDSVEAVGESVHLQSMLGKVTATTRPDTGSRSGLHVPYLRERHIHVSMSVCIEPN